MNQQSFKKQKKKKKKKKKKNCKCAVWTPEITDFMDVTAFASKNHQFWFFSPAMVTWKNYHISKGTFKTRSKRKFKEF